MDRYNEVKVLLKKWEQEFVKEHRNKPTNVSLRKAKRQLIAVLYHILHMNFICAY